MKRVLAKVIMSISHQHGAHWHCPSPQHYCCVYHQRASDEVAVSSLQTCSPFIEQSTVSHSTKPEMHAEVLTMNEKLMTHGCYPSKTVSSRKMNISICKFISLLSNHSNLIP